MEATTTQTVRLEAQPYRWVILAVGVVATAALSAVQLGLPAVAPLLREQFGLSLAALGAVLASVSWGVSLTLLPWGALADRIGERAVIATGLGAASIALVLAALAPGVGWLVAGLVLAGACGASAASASGRAVMGWFPRRERGTALGVRQMAVPLGGAAAALALPAIAAAGGLRAALLSLAAVCLVGAAAAARWLREPPPWQPRVPPPVSPPPLRDARVWRLSAGSALIVCAQVVLLLFLVVFLHDEVGLGTAAAAALLAAAQLVGGAARVLAGRWSDRTEQRIVPLRRLALATAIVLGAAAPVAAVSPALGAPVLLAGAVLSMSWNGLSFTAAAELAGRNQAGTALGLQGTVMRAGSAGVGAAFGALVAATSWPVALVALALGPVAGWLLLAPLENEEEERRRARARRLAAVPTPDSATLRTDRRAPRPAPQQRKATRA